MEPAGKPQPNEKQPQTTAGAEPALETLSFEQAADELERLVEDMENRVLPLEEMLSHYERGVKLAVQCGQKLSAAEKRIEIIKRLSEGDVTLAPLDAESEPALNPTPVSGTDVEEPADPAPNPRTRNPTRKAPGTASQATPPPAAPDATNDDEDELSLF